MKPFLPNTLFANQAGRLTWGQRWRLLLRGVLAFLAVIALQGVFVITIRFMIHASEKSSFWDYLAIVGSWIGFTAWCAWVGRLSLLGALRGSVLRVKEKVYTDTERAYINSRWGNLYIPERLAKHVIELHKTYIFYLVGGTIVNFEIPPDEEQINVAG